MSFRSFDSEKFINYRLQSSLNRYEPMQEATVSGKYFFFDIIMLVPKGLMLCLQASMLCFVQRRLSTVLKHQMQWSNQGYDQPLCCVVLSPSYWLEHN